MPVKQSILLITVHSLIWTKDFGKEKIGGPFSEEWVEDVKTILHILPLLIAAGAYLTLNVNEAFLFHSFQTTISIHNSATGMQALIEGMQALVSCVPYNYTPIIMKRAGVRSTSCTLDTVGHLHSNTTHCMLDTVESGC